MENDKIIIEKLKTENSILKEEITFYKKLLIKNNIAFDFTSNNKISPYLIQLNKDEKIKVYLDYFKGRTDVFAEKWISKQGIKGYSPVCKNNFIQGVCYKKTTSCIKCKNSKFVSFNSDRLLEHLKGDKVYGIYPLLTDNTCYFLAIDFDNGDYINSSVLVHKICKSYDIDTLIEKSSSGQGAHLWTFFEDKVPALLARKVFSYILSEAILLNGNIDFGCFDRMFPSQDKIPNEGFGNLILLPLSGKYGKEGNTLFVDDKFNVVDNQYAALLNTKKVTFDDLKLLESKFIDDDKDDLSSLGKKLKNITLTKLDAFDKIVINVSNKIIIRKNVLSNKLLGVLKRICSFPNKKYYELMAIRKSVYNTPKIIKCFEENDHELLLPRGVLNQIIQLFKISSIEFEINDYRNNGLFIDVNFKSKLREEQNKVIESIKYETQGFIVAPTGFGKTVLASYLISKLKINTLIVVNNVSQIEQWVNKLNEFLELNYEGVFDKKGNEIKIGQIYSQKKIITNKIDIILVQTLSSNEDYFHLSKSYGLIICDEGHHMASISYGQVIKTLNSKYLYALTATPERSDYLEKINYLLF